MACLIRTIRHLAQSAVMLCTFVITAAGFLRLCLRSSAALAAEHLFLRQQLARYQEHHVKPQRAPDATRCTLSWLSHWLGWRQALTVVQPETFMRWGRPGFRRFWHGTPSPGRPPIPVELQALIRQIAHENLTWGQRRIANELQLKLGLRVSPRTVYTYTPKHLHPAPGHRPTSQRWRTFVRQHAWDLVARGMASALTRGVQAVAAQIRWLLQWCRRPTVASGWRGTLRRDPTCLAQLSPPASGLAVWSPVIVEAIRVDQRSPPDRGLSRFHAPGLATQAIAVDRFDVYPAGAALYGR
jgi:hypothetical protein